MKSNLHYIGEAVLCEAHPQFFPSLGLNKPPKGRTTVLHHICDQIACFAFLSPARCLSPADVQTKCLQSKYLCGLSSLLVPSSQLQDSSPAAWKESFLARCGRKQKKNEVHRITLEVSREHEYDWFSTKN